MISREEILKLAELARLSLSDEEIEQLQNDLDEMLEFVKQLQQVDTEGVEPMSHSIDLKSVMRPDKLTASLPVEEALKNAPARIGDFFKVPKVIDL
jgi:aspartyl-tRNA(Asn)/glutamyl-tRNA(Gln) amidotransferase subunit C